VLVVTVVAVVAVVQQSVEQVASVQFLFTIKEIKWQHMQY
jgi:hypothetical protein